MRIRFCAVLLKTEIAPMPFTPERRALLVLEGTKWIRFLSFPERSNLFKNLTIIHPLEVRVEIHAAACEKEGSQCTNHQDIAFAISVVYVISKLEYTCRHTFRFYIDESQFAVFTILSESGTNQRMSDVFQRELAECATSGDTASFASLIQVLCHWIEFSYRNRF